jgi:hypothetical protein
MKEKIKKIFFILVFIFLLFLLLILSNFVYTSFSNKLFVESTNEKVKEIFTIDKIVFFSSCSADSSINSNTTTTINNLLQYTDIAIFIDTPNKDLSLENTLKSVSIKGFSFNASPNLGTPKLYYKSLTNFATPSIVEDNLIESDLNFSISSEDEIDYNKPILFNNCANPITLSYVNSNIANNYTIDNNSNSISYDGSILKKCNVLLSDIKCSFSFTINIENNLGEKFRCPIYINIPLGDDNSSIYEGSYIYSYNPNWIFAKIK